MIFCKLSTHIFLCERYKCEKNRKKYYISLPTPAFQATPPKEGTGGTGQEGTHFVLGTRRGSSVPSWRGVAAERTGCVLLEETIN